MPIAGPNGKPMYCAGEAWGIVGTKLFGQDEYPPYTEGEAWPHAEALIRRIDQGDMGLLRRFGDPRSAKYRETQQQLFRSTQIWFMSVHALRTLKAEGWLRYSAEWMRVDLLPGGWSDGSMALVRLAHDLLKPIIGIGNGDDLLIDQDGWDHYFGPEESKGFGNRQREIPHDWAIEILNEMRVDGSIAGLTKEQACTDLIARWKETHPGWPGMRATSLVKTLKAPLDEIIAGRSLPA